MCTETTRDGSAPGGWKVYDSRFFEKSELKQVRDTLDCEADEEAVNALVTAEGAVWTDYLNFFELVAYLQESKQVAAQDVIALFEYYIGCLKRHRAVVMYIEDQAKVSRPRQQPAQILKPPLFGM